MNSVEAAFTKLYRTSPSCYWAPGRINLIGDHVDYCGGHVLPMPIQFGTTVALVPRGDDRVRAASSTEGHSLDFCSGSPPGLPVGHWGRFVTGAITLLKEMTSGPVGFDVFVHGDVPGSGLSSSASLAVGLLYAFTDALGLDLPRIDIACAARRVEHEHVGVLCGLMDQAVISLGAADAALVFDCAEQTGRVVPIPGDAPAIAVFDTRKTRALAHSGYNERFSETARVAQLLGVRHDRLALVGSDATRGSAPTDQRRLRHVVTEEARVQAAVRSFESREWGELGRLFDASHQSLRSDFEVSCEELDLAAALLRGQQGCLGARMTGGGFGGCVVALFDPDLARHQAEIALSRVAARYLETTGLESRHFFARSLGGVKKL